MTTIHDKMVGFFASELGCLISAAIDQTDLIDGPHSSLKAEGRSDSESMQMIWLAMAESLQMISESMKRKYDQHRKAN